MSSRFLSSTLAELLPADHTLVLDRESQVLIELAQEEEGCSVVEVQHCSDQETHVRIVLLSAFAYFCPFEVLLAALSNAAEDEETVKRWRKRLERAAAQGTGDAEIRPVRAVLSRCRAKLVHFQVDVSSMLETGYTLAKPGPYRRWARDR
jgi:hypothetical protein